MKLYNCWQWFRDHRLPVRIIICKARRAGLSTAVESLVYDDTTMHAHTDSLIVANERSPSENILDMCRTFWRETPVKVKIGDETIRVRPTLPREFNNNPPKDRFVFESPPSRIFLASSRSIDAYLSYRFTNIHATEASRYIDGHDLFRALYPTLIDSPHSALYVESTPNGQDGRGRWFYEQVMAAAQRKKTGYGETRLVFVPWHEMKYSFSLPFSSPEKRQAFAQSMTGVEKDVMQKWDVSLEQMMWYRMVLNGPTCNGDQDIMDAEYPSDLATAFIASGSSVFSRKAIKRMMMNAREPIWEGDIYWGKSDKDNASRPIHETVREPRFLSVGEAYAEDRESHVNEKTFDNLRVWRWPKAGDRLFIGCDVGQGKPETDDGDPSTVVVGCLNELAQDEMLMSWSGHINPIAFGEVASALAWGCLKMVRDRVPAPQLAPEWTGPGTAMCTYIDKKNLYPHLWRYRFPGVHNMPASKHIGWESNVKTKPIMVGHTLRMVERNLIDIPDKDTILQMASYRQLDSYGDESSYGGAAGRHDDLVTALQIVCACTRIMSATIPGDADAEEVSLGLDDSDDEPAFDPFAAEERPMGLGEYEVDEESLEDALWFGS